MKGVYLTIDDVRRIEKALRDGASRKATARRYRVTYNTISFIARGKHPLQLRHPATPRL